MTLHECFDLHARYTKKDFNKFCIWNQKFQGQYLVYHNLWGPISCYEFNTQLHNWLLTLAWFLRIVLWRVFKQSTWFPNKHTQEWTKSQTNTNLIISNYNYNLIISNCFLSSLLHHPLKTVSRIPSSKDVCMCVCVRARARARVCVCVLGGGGGGV